MGYDCICSHSILQSNQVYKGNFAKIADLNTVCAVIGDYADILRNDILVMQSKTNI